MEREQQIILKLIDELIVMKYQSIERERQAIRDRDYFVTKVESLIQEAEDGIEDKEC